MTYWYKAANTLIDDTKLRIVSAKLKISHCETVATFHSLLERCSKDSDENFTEDLQDLIEEIDLQLGISNAQNILKEFQSRNIIDGTKLLKWNEHQANTSTQRVKEWRAKKQNETLRNVTVTDVTQTRLEKNRIDKTIIEQLKQKYLALDIIQQQETFEDYCKANGKTYKDYNAAFRNWCKRAETYRLNNTNKQTGGFGNGSSETEAQRRQRLANVGK